LRYSIIALAIVVVVVVVLVVVVVASIRQCAYQSMGR